MSTSSKKLFSFLIFSISLFALAFDSFAQCGVYSKRVYTDKFPYSKVHLHTAEDMTGDGIADLFLAGEASNSQFRRDRIFILPNNGDGTFGDPYIINAPAQTPFYDEFLIGKVNNDSLNDIVVSFTEYPSTVQVYINNGNGTFTAQTSFSNSGQMGRAINFLDINNDGKGDYMGIATSGDFKFSLGNGDGTFAAPVTLTSSGSGISYPGDFNNDGLVDFINSRNLYMNQGNANFVPVDITSITNNQFPGGVKDYTGDGKTDFILGTTNGFALLKKTDASANSFERVDYSLSDNSVLEGFAYVGNFSGSSSPDLLYDIRFQNRKIVFTNDGAGNFTRQEYRDSFTNFKGSVMKDFDNDGKDDLIQLTSGTSNSTLLLRDTTSFTFLKNACNGQGQPRIVDFDRSGTTDFSYWKPSTGAWSYLTNTRTNRQTETINLGSESFGDMPAPGDFDGDGITDRAVFRNSTGTWYIRRSSDQTLFSFQFGLTGDKPVAADFDGDTISDIAVWRPSDGNWYIWHMGTQQFSAVNFGLAGDKAIPADFDGDFKTDIAVFRPSTGVWYYLKSSDGSFRAAQWGISTDKPMPADFDGDGNADLVIYRESENNLYILKSSDNSFAGYNWGTSQDKPAIFDVDGDYVADFVVYRPSTKAWWLTIIWWGGAVFGDENVVLTSSILRVE